MAGVLFPEFKIVHFKIIAMTLSKRLITFLLPFFPIKASTQDHFNPGFVITISNEKIADSLKLSEGKLIATKSGRKKIYMPWEVKGFSINTLNYVSYSNDFYKEIISGAKAGLYQKLTDYRNEKMYNGTEMIGFVKTTEGRKGDYYVLLATQTKLELITKKNFNTYFITLFNGNDSLIAKIKNGSLNYDQVEEAISLFNKH